jgi:uncharacterized protein YxeA
VEVDNLKKNKNMKKIVYIIITTSILAMVAIYLFSVGTLDDIQKPIVQTQEGYCANAGDGKQDCIFEYRENFICQNEDKTKEKEIMVIMWEDQGEELELNLLSSNMNRCIYTGSFQEYTQLQSGEATYKANIEMFERLGEQGVFRYMLENCTDFEKEESLCTFYTSSFFKYVESLKEKEGDVLGVLEI